MYLVGGNIYTEWKLSYLKDNWDRLGKQCMTTLITERILNNNFGWKSLLN